MKEIKILIQQLRSYPDNFFVYPSSQCDLPEGTYSPNYVEEHTVSGLVVCDMNGVQQGFIETGGVKATDVGNW